MSTGSFPGVKNGRGVMLTPHLLLVPWSRKSRAIPLLPLWAVRPLQSLSACTVQLYLYSLYGLYGLCRSSVPVQYSYTSTPPMGCTACAEPQCLNRGALYLLLFTILLDWVRVVCWEQNVWVHCEESAKSSRWYSEYWYWLRSLYLTLVVVWAGESWPFLVCYR